MKDDLKGMFSISVRTWYLAYPWSYRELRCGASNRGYEVIEQLQVPWIPPEWYEHEGNTEEDNTG